jgi:pyruvate,water dikinase
MIRARSRLEAPRGRQAERCMPLERALDVEACGNKAVNLGRMLRAGLPVPAGFVLTAAALDDFISAADLHAVLARIVSDPASGADPEARACDALMSIPLPPPLRCSLVEIARRFPADGALAVRSSAVGEDGKHASFAGLFRSILGVQASAEALEAAVKRCWASRWSAGAAAYAKAPRQRLPAIAVIVQAQVDARFAGVLFTRSPQAAHSDEMLCEYCAGLADRLVSGEITPESVAIARKALAVRRIPAQSAPTGGERADPIDWRQLARTAIEAERMFGAPQDIEWAIDHAGRAWLVQSRPITAAAASSAPPVVWSNANVCENFPGPITPLTYSIAAQGYAHYFRNLGRAFGLARRRLERMSADFKVIIGVHAGRMYYNLSAIHAVLALAPLGSRLIAWFDDFTGAGAHAKAQPQSGFVVAAGNAVELARILCKTTWQYAFVDRRVARFEARVDLFAARTRPQDLGAKSLIELRDALRCFLDLRCNRWTDAALADAAAMVCYGALKSAVATVCADAAQQAQMHNALLTGLSGLKSAEPIEALWALARTVRTDPKLTSLFRTGHTDRILERLRTDPAAQEFNRMFEDYLERWGFRCSGELMLTVASFQERPEALLEIVRAHASGPDTAPEGKLAAQRASREAATERVLALAARRRLLRFSPWPSRAAALKVLLRATQGAIGLRERARYKQALLYSRVRRIALEIGERLQSRRLLAAAEDVFMLSIAELDDLVSGVAMFPGETAALVALRRDAHARFALQSPADVLCAPLGDYPSTAGNQGMRSEHGAALRGSSVCAGVARGPAKILESVAETHTLAVGDILVTGQTDPGWAPAFANIAGLVLERGGMLSHGAILAREYGIPTVVGVADATKRIATGALLEVDGDRGDVRLVA